MTRKEWLTKKLNEINKKLQKDSFFIETKCEVYYSNKKYKELLEELKIIVELISETKE